MPGRFADADPVLFDLDGTLTESGPGIISSVRYALAKMGRPVPDDATLDRFIGPPLLDSFRDLCGFDPAEVTVAIAAYREHYATDGQYNNSVYDGIPELLDGLGPAPLPPFQEDADGLFHHRHERHRDEHAEHS